MAAAPTRLLGAGCAVAEARAMWNASPASILIVEDHESCREVLTTLLATEGFCVRAAKDGQEALDLLQAGLRPSLLIIDLGLPKVSGSELLKYAHQDPELRSIPAIIMTAVSPERKDVVADQVFIKPVDVTELLNAIGRLCAGGTE